MKISEHNKLYRNLPTGKNHYKWKEGVKRVGTDYVCEFCGKKGKRTRHNQKVCSHSCAVNLRWRDNKVNRNTSKKANI